MMEHTTKTGEPKIVERCSYPLTGLACVSRIYTDLAVIDVTRDGLQVRELAEGVSLADLQAKSGAPLRSAA
jgi:3-oxoadipate CoA-transferase beta subunit